MDSAITSAPLPMLAFCSQVSPLKVSSGRPSNNELSNWSTSCLRKVWIFKTQRNLLSGSAWNWWSGNWNWLSLLVNFPNPKTSKHRCVNRGTPCASWLRLWQVVDANNFAPGEKVAFFWFLKANMKFIQHLWVWHLFNDSGKFAKLKAK